MKAELMTVYNWMGIRKLFYCTNLSTGNCVMIIQTVKEI